MRKIFFITTNPYKFKKLSEVFRTQEIEIIPLAEETPEIQAKNNREVAEYSAKWATKKFNLPVVKEDVGMYIEALDGFPGVYLNQIEKWIKAEGYLQLLQNTKNRTAYWEYAIAYCEPGKEPISFYTHQKGSISTAIKGEKGYFTDKIFIPEQQEKTIAELLDEGAYERNNQHYQKLFEFLLNENI